MQFVIQNTCKSKIIYTCYKNNRNNIKYYDFCYEIPKKY